MRRFVAIMGASVAVAAGASVAGDHTLAPVVVVTIGYTLASLAALARTEDA